MTKKYFVRIFIVLLIAMVPVVATAETWYGGLGLEWPLKNQEEREKAIKYYHDQLFKKVIYKIPKNQFKSFKNDPNFFENIEALKKNTLTLPDRQLAGFYMMKKLLVIYGVEYKADKYHVYYYDALGHLAYYDVLDKPQDQFPHVSQQYKSNGNLVGMSYYIADNDQYVFDEKENFKGRWYNEKMYDKRAKIIMTRKLP